MDSIPPNAVSDGLRTLQNHGPTVRMSEALELGLSRWLIYKLRDEGHLEPLSRGLYRLTATPEPAEPDLVVVARRVPHGVVCLISALAFHELTTAVPHHVDLAIARGQRIPKIDYPPTRIYTFSKKAHGAAIEQHRLNGVNVRVYSPEKTVADIFKYRHKLGQDIAVEALKRWYEKNKPDVRELMRCARINRVARVIQPYVEALL